MAEGGHLVVADYRRPRTTTVTDTTVRPWVPAPQDPPRVGSTSSGAWVSPDPVADLADPVADLAEQPLDHTLTEAADTQQPAVAPVDDRSRPHQKPPLSRRLTAAFTRFVDASRPRRGLTPLEQLSETQPPDRLNGWLVTLAVTGLAFFLRWFHLGQPSEIMFDETYYAKDAWSVLQLGYEGSWPGDAAEVNAQVAAGDPSALSTAPSWAVHPEVGKWLIATGEHLFGLNAFGWRFMALVFGSLLVWMVIRLARRLSRSTLIGGLAGLLISVDGLSFVMSRIALLDIFQAFFILAGVACVVADRDYFRHRLAEIIRRQPGETLAGRTGPYVFRGWLVLAGIMFGLGCGVKWNTVYPMAVFGLLGVIWSLQARRLAGAASRAWWALLKDGVPAFVSLVVVALAVYLVSWIPWLRATGGYLRDWGSQHPDSWVTRHFGEALASLWHWHVETYGFHTGDQMVNATHTYASNPWGWPVQARTIGIYALNDIAPGVDGCTAEAGQTCLRVVTGLGTPLLWWLAAAAMLAALVWWLAGMDWRFSVVVLGMASTWLPWMFTGRGALFSFYAITMIPFMVIALAMALGVILGPARPGPRRQLGAIVVGVVVTLIVLDFAFIYPVLTGEMLTRQQWQWRMWLTGWI